MKTNPVRSFISHIRRGSRFGAWKILSRSGSSCLCKCDCGTKRTIRAYKLIKSLTRSCGCNKPASIAKAKRTHGDSKSHSKHHWIYRLWQSIKSRCYSKKNNSYRNYGGRGIKFEWGDNYPGFKLFILNELGPPPGSRKKYQFERKNNDGDYRKGNVRWETAIGNNHNRRCSRFVKINGEKLHLTDAAKLQEGLNPKTAGARLRSGMSDHDAIYAPLGHGYVDKMRKKDLFVSKLIQDGVIFATTDGDIFDLRRRKELKPSAEKRGYKSVKIGGRPVQAHRVVALQWLKNPNSKRYLHVEHKDDNPGNNRLSNLRWATPQQNCEKAHNKRVEFAKKVRRNNSPYSERQAHKMMRPIFKEKGVLQPTTMSDPIRIRVGIKKILGGLARNRAFKNSIFDKKYRNRHKSAVTYDDAMAILLAPSNKLAIAHDDATIEAVSTSGDVTRVSIYKINERSRYRLYLGCEKCGFEDRKRREVYSSLGARNAGRGGFVCEICKSIACISPNFDRLRRSDPDTGALRNGHDIRLSNNIHELFWCVRCGKGIPESRAVKNTYNMYTYGKGPLCHDCGARVDRENLGLKG